MAVKPLADRVLIKQEEAAEINKSGIIIPDTAQEKPLQGEVIEVGPGRTEDGKLVPMEVKKGDKILYGAYAGKKVTIDDEEFIIASESEILAIIN